MAFKLSDFINGLENNVGRAVDAVVPGNQSNLHKSTPKPPAPASTARPQQAGFNRILPDLGRQAGSMFGINNGRLSLNPLANFQNIRSNSANLLDDLGAGVANSQPYKTATAYTPTVQGHQIPVGELVKSFVESPAHTVQRLSSLGVQGHQSYNGTPVQMAGQVGEDALNLVTAGRGGSLIDAAKVGGKPALKQIAKVLGEDIATGAGYGATTTAQDANASAMDYARNIAAGATLAPLAHGVGEAGFAGAGAATKATGKFAKSLGEDGYLAGTNAKGFEKAAEKGKTSLSEHNAQPFFEESDKDMKFKKSGVDALNKSFESGGTVPLSTLIDHGKLSKDYPNVMNDTKVVLDRSIPRPSQYNYDTNTIHINDMHPENSTVQGLRKSVAHETQHAIDEFEQLPRGTTIEPRLSKADQAIYDKLTSHYQEVGNRVQAQNLMLEQKREALLRQGMDPRKVVQSLQDEASANPDLQLLDQIIKSRQTVAARATKPGADEVATNNYLNNLAEGRAHQVEQRSEMSARQIKKAPVDPAFGIKPGQVADNIRRSGVAAREILNRVEKDDGSAQSALNAMAKEYAAHLKQLHEDTGGVHTIKDGDGFTQAKVSSNDPFYSKFYKDHGKAPTNADWLDEAHRKLSKGKDELAQAYQATKSMVSEKPVAKAVVKENEFDRFLGQTPDDMMLHYRSASSADRLHGTEEKFWDEVSNGLGAGKSKEQVFNDLKNGVKSTPVVKAKAVSPESPKKEAIKPSETIKVPEATKASVEARPMPENSKQYVKEQVAAQEAARKTESGGIKGKTHSIISEIKTKLIDSNAPIEDILNKVIKDGADIKPSDNITYQIDKTLRSDLVASQFAKDHGLINAIIDAPNADEFNQYLIAKHAQDLKVKEIKTGRNDEADAKLIKDFAPKYEKLAKVVNKYSQNLLDYAAEKGLVSKETAAQLKFEYPNYVPMNRIFNEEELPTFKGNGRGPASISGQSVVQKLKGSEREVENPLESLLVKTQTAFKQGELNDAARMLVSYKDLPGNPFNLRELKHGEAVGMKNTVSFLDKGVKKVYETSPEIANAAKSLNKEQLGLVGKILSYPTRILRLGATGINLPFVASNIVRDQASMFINSDHAMATSIANPKNFLKAMFNAVGHGKEYENLLRAGAGGTSFDIARDAAKDTVSKIRAEHKLGPTAFRLITKPGEVLRHLEDMVGRSEELGRIQQFTGTRDALLKEGKSPQDAEILAAHAARNNSTNFSRSGDYGRVLNAVLPYLNASVQGSRTFVRNSQNRPAQTAAKVATTVLFPAAALTAWNLSDPKRKEAYDNIQEYEKGGNFILIPPNPTKDEKGRWNVIKIPISQEIANLADIVRNGVEAASKDASFDIGKMAGNLLGTTTSLNAGEPRQLVGQIIPQALKPAIEGLTNTNLFTGNQIVPQSLQNYPAGKQYKPETSGTAVKLGKALGISPLQIQNAVGTAAGGVGNQILNASDRALVKFGVTQPSQIAGQDALDTTFAKFSKAKGKSDSQLQYEQELKTKKQNAAGTASKALLEAGLEGDGSMKGVDPKAQTRIKTATGKFAGNLSKPASQVLTDYAKLDSTAKSAFNDDPAKVYQLHQAQYENNKKNGKLTDVEDFKAQQTLGKEAITSKYSKDVQDFYGLSKDAQTAYFATDRTKATELYDQAKKLDQELNTNRFTTTPKYKYGLGKKPKKAKSLALKSRKFDYSKRVSVKGGNGSSNVTALRKLVMGSKITVHSKKA